MRALPRFFLVLLLAGMGIASKTFAVDSNVLSGKWVSSDANAQKIQLEINGDKVKSLEVNGESVLGADLNTCLPPNGHGLFLSVSWSEKEKVNIKDCYLHCALGANGKGETRLRGFLAVCNVEDNQANKCKDYEVELKRGN